MNKEKGLQKKIFAVTGTVHGSIITAISEGEARKIFHNYYKGESIILIKISTNWI